MEAQRNKKQAAKARRGQQNSDYNRISDDANANAHRESNEEFKDSMAQNSQRNDRDTVVERIMNIEKDISVIQSQQDTYTQLLGLKDVVEVLQNDNRLLHTLVKRASNIEGMINTFHNEFVEYQQNTNESLADLKDYIQEEAKARAEDNKKFQKVCTELERRQNEMDYQIKSDIKSTQIKAKEELLSTSSDIDKKADAHKEIFENHINSVHNTLQDCLVDDDKRINDLYSQLQQVTENFEGKIDKINNLIMPSLDNANKRRKIDYTDLKAWLIDSIDNRISQSEQKLKNTVKNNYRSTVLQQKSEIDTLKKEITQISEASPNIKMERDSLVRQSNTMNSNTNVGEGYVDEFSPAEEVKSQASLAQNDESVEAQFAKSVNELKSSINEIEKITIDSSDEIGNKLDQQKISIGDWIDKISKTNKKISKMGKSKNKATKSEIKSISKDLIKEFETFERSMSDEITEVREDVNSRKDKLVTEIQEMEGMLKEAQTAKKKATKGNPTERSKKLSKLRSEVSKLESATKNLEQLKKQIETSHNYLSKGVTSIETKLFTARQILGRDIESNLDA